MTGSGRSFLGVVAVSAIAACSPAKDHDKFVCCGVVNRGVALYRGRVYVGTIDGKLIALDERSGKPVWIAQTTPVDSPYSITGAPRIAAHRRASPRIAAGRVVITHQGLMLTNLHNVRDVAGTLASGIAIKFRNDTSYLRAHLVKVPMMGASLDLALIQMDDSLADYNTVAGIQARDENADEGASVAIIGFPLGYETAQEGSSGENFKAKSSLIGGTVSKRTTSILQIDSYAAHGSSGSPVISAKGLVIGVVWGGRKDAGGRIVYAVPRERIIAFLPDRLRDQVVK